jgi:carboxyl-terminal processing protease
MLVLSCAMALPAMPAFAQVAPTTPAAGQQVASVDQLKTEAFEAARGGQFDKTNELLAMAAKISKDPQLAQMAAWTGQFESQRLEFATERHGQYEKSVVDVHKLIDAGQGDYAIDAAARAYLLADDKDAFGKEPWVSDLIKKSETRAKEFEDSEQWIKALRMYVDLSAVEPYNPEWKHQLKAATRRVRLLAIYTPDVLHDLQEKEAKSREAADRVLRPEAATQSATTKPVEDLAADAFQIDWRDTVRGVNLDMLKESLHDARENYYRDVHYRDLAQGGIDGVRAIITTKGLEKTFSGLANDAKRGAFSDILDQCQKEVADSTAADEESVLGDVLNKIYIANRASIGLPPEVLITEFADGAFAELDPFSSIIWPSDLQEFAKMTQGEFEGVGIQIQNDEEGNVKVVTPIEDSPAARAGVEPGSIITAIDGKSARNISVNQAVKIITGPAGSKVTLTIRNPAGVVKDFVLKRQTIKVASVKGWKQLPGGGWDYFVDPDQKIGYMRLTSFSRTTSEDMNNAIDAMTDKGAKAIIMDLRNNPGGLLVEATRVSDRFLKKGTIVSTRADRETPNPPSEARAHADRDDISLPLVVLVNQYSASASEIVSGALKDLHRAIVVGERTFGKGSVQMLFPLDGRNAMLKLTTSHYYLPSGRCLHREENSTTWGVDPDVVVEMTPEQMRTANEARQEMDILRDANSPEPEPQAMNDSKADNNVAANPATQPADSVAKKDRKGLIGSDPQLAAGLLLLRLELNGAHLEMAKF